MKKYTLLIATLLLAFTLGGCGEEKVARETSVQQTAKEVEIFDLSREKAQLTFTKTAIANSESSSYVMPQVSGNITDIKVKGGDKVEKGQTLVSLGESLSTDISNIQYQSAKEGLSLSEQAKTITEDSIKYSLSTASDGVYTAYNSYLNAVQTKTNAENTFDLQYDNALLALDNAEENYRTAKDNYNDLQDTIDDLENDLYRLSPNDAGYSQIESSLDQAESQLSSLRMAKNAADNGVEQAENAIDLLEENFDAQLNQLDFAINNAYSQYQIARKQYYQAANSADLQKIQSESALLQAETSAKTTQLQQQYRNIKAPIAGIITEISAEEGNMASPGQVLMTIESQDSLLIKTGINFDEKELVAIGDTVTIEADGKTVEGEISAILPSANSQTKKIDLEIIVEEPEKIIPGSFIKINFNPDTKSAIYIPLNSIFTAKGENYVRLVENDSIAIKTVEVGKVFGDYIEILGGLNGNEKIIKASTAFLEEGDKIKIVND
ncbi:efflux RND transporter periplasmic adaptor subunit [Patescibacteria group bacterium]|nr:efflux RND transporter periplasmic adaptor subunit [Patescibacteria group bacterium]